MCVRLCVCVSVCLWFCLCVQVFAWPSFSMYYCVCACVSVCLSVCLHVWLVCPCVSLSICLAGQVLFLFFLVLSCVLTILCPPPPLAAVKGWQWRQWPIKFPHCNCVRAMPICPLRCVPLIDNNRVRSTVNHTTPTREHSLQGGCKRIMWELSIYSNHCIRNVLLHDYGVIKASMTFFYQS